MYTLLEKFWQISLYVIDDAIARDVKFCQLEGNDREFSHIEPSVIS